MDRLRDPEVAADAEGGGPPRPTIPEGPRSPRPAGARGGLGYERTQHGRAGRVVAGSVDLSLTGSGCSRRVARAPGLLNTSWGAGALGVVVVMPTETGK